MDLSEAIESLSDAELDIVIGFCETIKIRRKLNNR